MVEDKAYQATPVLTLERQIMDSNVPKNEREWWARNEIERLREEYLSIEKQLGETQVRCSEIGERLLGEIERLLIHYDGTIMYGNRLVDLIDWAERNGIDFPAKIYNPCVIAIDHFRNERERLKETE